MRRPKLSLLPRGAVSAPFTRRATDVIRAKRAAGTIVCAIATGKGGSGKTTLTLNLGMAYSLRGKKVLVVDADFDQASASKWPRSSKLGGPKIVVWRTPEIVERLAAAIKHYDVVLVDFAGRDDRAAAPVIAAADILISPTKPSRLDFSELGRFIRVAEVARVPHLVVFNEATRETTREMQRLTVEFPHLGPYLPVAVQQLTDYRRAYGRGRSVLEAVNDIPAKINFERVFERIDSAIHKAKASSRKMRT